MGASDYGSRPPVSGAENVAVPSLSTGGSTAGYNGTQCPAGCQPIVFKFGEAAGALTRGRALSVEDFDASEVAVGLSYAVFQQLAQQASSFSELQVLPSLLMRCPAASVYPPPWGGGGRVMRASMPYISKCLS